jgi:hypothetical protein
MIFYFLQSLFLKFCSEVAVSEPVTPKLDGDGGGGARVLFSDGWSSGAWVTK